MLLLTPKGLQEGLDLNSPKIPVLFFFGGGEGGGG